MRTVFISGEKSRKVDRFKLRRRCAESVMQREIEMEGREV